MAGKSIVKKKCCRFLGILLALVLALGALPPAVQASDYLTVVLTVSNSQVNAAGTTTADTCVTLLVTRVSDDNKSYMDQTRSDETGGFSFSFKMEEGSYRATFTSNGLTVQRDFIIKNSKAGTVTVRVEGAEATRLPQSKVDILAGETTLLEAVQTALELSGVEYEMSNGLIHKIAGEEGWQWMVNGQGLMFLPSDLLQDGDNIVLVDDALWDPTLTKLTLSADRVDAGKSFTVTLIRGSNSTPAAGQTIVFNDEEKTTNAQGQVSFIGAKEGNYYVTAETTGSLVRPVPVPLTVGKASGGDGPVTDNRIRVKMRIEGYKGTLFDDTVVFDPNDYKEGSKYVITDPDGVEHECSKANVLLATIVAWNEGKIKDNTVSYNENYVARMGGEEEFDFKKEHLTCGWMVRVNDYMINQGVGVWPIKDGDEVVWYYGDLDSHFGYINVSPTSLDPGGTIKVKVTGKGNNIGQTGKSVKIADATVYVDDEEYVTDENGEVTITLTNSGTYEVYAEKVDKNSKNGSYYFPLLSRTERVEVTVKGNSTGGTSNTTGTTAVEAAGQQIMEAGKVTLSADQITVENGKTSASVTAQDLTLAVKSMEAEIAAVKAAGTLTAEEIAALKKQVTLVVPEKGSGAVEVTLDAAATSLLKQVDSLKIVSEVANLEFSAAALGAGAQGKEITFTASKVDCASLTEQAQSQVPAGSIVVDLTLRAGGSAMKSFDEPVLVGIPYGGSAQNGDKITVFLIKEDGTVEPVGGIYDAAEKRVKFFTNHFSKYFAKESVKQFTDLAKYPWAKDAVEIMAGKGIIGGRDSSKFDPSAPITRAEFAALITRMLKYETKKEVPFADVGKDRWYYADVAAAYEKGLIKGRSADIFDPVGKITRQEMAAIIAKVLLKNGAVSEKDSILDSFKDKEKIGSWARSAVATAVQKKIITGMGDGNFAPEQKATRAQAAVMLYRLYKLVLQGGRQGDSLI